MRSSIFMLVMVIGSISCSSSGDSNSTRINYATLDSLQTERVVEITESDDYLPGQLQDLYITPDGDLIVADWASQTLEQFDSQGNHRATIAEKGEGPGEMGSYFQFEPTGNDTLLVNSMISNKKDYFVPGADGLYTFDHAYTPAERPNRSFKIVGGHSNHTYYGTAGNTFGNFQELSKNEVDYTENIMAVVSSTGTVLQDSIQQYKSSLDHYMGSPSEGIQVHWVPFRFDDAIAVLADYSYVIARPDSSAAYVYDSNSELQQTVPLPFVERPLTADDIEEKLGDIEDPRMRNGIEDRIGDTKPPFYDMWATSDYLFLLTKDTDATKEIVVVDYEGAAVGKIVLSGNDDIQKITGTTIYTIHRSPKAGHSVRTYNLIL